MQSFILFISIFLANLCHLRAFLSPSSFQRATSSHEYSTKAAPSHFQLHAQISASTNSNEELLNTLLNPPNGDVDAVVQENLNNFDYSFMNFVQSKIDATSGREQGNLGKVLYKINTTLQQKLIEADGKLRAVLQAGELPEMEAKLQEYIDKGEIDMSFLVTLNMNIQEAKVNNVENAFGLLTHLSMYVQQMMEQELPKPVQLLRLLLRTDCKGARENILRDRLLVEGAPLPAAPSPEAGMWGDADVTPQELSNAINDVQLQVEEMDKEMALGLTERVTGLMTEIVDVTSGKFEGLVCDTEKEGTAGPTEGGAQGEKNA